MKILNKKNIILCIGIMTIFLGSFIISSYKEVWRYIFYSGADISSTINNICIEYYKSKYHIWYNSFFSFHLLVFLLIPVITSVIYAKSYYNKTDIYYIYRQGFKKYYIKSFFKMLGMVTLVVAIPILVYWGLLNLLPTTNEILIEGSQNSMSNYISPITIFNDSIRELIYFKASSYVYYTIITFVISGINYGIYSYALGNLVKSRIVRYLLPLISLTVLDLIMGSYFRKTEGSLLFDLFNTAISLNNRQVIIVNLFLFIVSIILLFIHYKKRNIEG